MVGPQALWNPDTWWQSIAVWFAAAIIAHDLVLFPMYALADRLLVATQRSAHRCAVPALNYIRVPALGAALTLLVFLPGIIEQGAPTYWAATGADPGTFSRAVAAAHRGVVRRQRGHVRNPPDGGSSSYGRVRVATTRVPMTGCRPPPDSASSASSAAQSMPTEAHRNHGPIVLDDSSRTQPGRIPVTIASNSAMQWPARRNNPSPGAAHEAVTAQPDVAVGEQNRLPSTGTGQGLEHVAAQHRRSAAPRQFHRRGGLVDAQCRNATPNELGTNRPGPQPRSMVGPHTAPNTPCRTARRRACRRAIGAPEDAELTVVVADQHRSPSSARSYKFQASQTRTLR